MGGACSMQSEASTPGERDSPNHNSVYRSGSSRRDRKLSRHSVLRALPDDSIAHLYPIADNYTEELDGTRSPKTLAELSADSVCRSMAYLDGELPAGLPQDVVDDLVKSLVKHNALNATVLRILKYCEIGCLTLSGCRGVEDEWFDALASNSFCSSSSSPLMLPQNSENTPMDSMDLDHSEVFYSASHDDHHEIHPSEESSCSSASFVSASSTVRVTPESTPEYMMEGVKLGSQSHQIYYKGQVQSQSVTNNMTLLDLRGSQRLTDRGLIKLANLSRLEVARLDNCHSIVGRGLLAFSMSHHLHTLSLANCRRLTDEAIINISHLKSLEALSLNGCRCITDRALIALSERVRLKKLDLSQCDLITNDGLDELEHLWKLEELSLGWCRLISDEGVDILTRHAGRSKYLRILSLARCPITDTGIEFVSRLEALEELDLNGCSDIGSAALGKALGSLKHLQCLDVSYCPGILRSSWQGNIQSLRRLDLCYSGVRDSHMAKLTHLPNMEELSLDSCVIGDWAMAHLADNEVVPNLTSLDLADTDLSDLGMVHIAKFVHLKRLSLFFCNISNDGLRHLSSLTKLEALNLDSRDVGDEGLAHLRHLRHLRSLDIFSGRITDVGCLHLARIKSLESLELCGGGIGDMGCSLIAKLENLTSLNLSQNERITNQGGAALAALVNLKTLNLSHTRVTSSVLVHFSELIKLQSLALFGCHDIEESSHGLNRLQNELPALKCVRLHSQGSNEDGRIRQEGDTTDDETDDDDDGIEEENDDDDIDMHVSSPYATRPPVGSQDDDSDMDEAEFASGSEGEDTRGDNHSSHSSDSELD